MKDELDCVKRVISLDANAVVINRLATPSVELAALTSMDEYINR
jgi:hypothetical protein